MADENIVCPSCGEAFQNQGKARELLNEERIRAQDWVKEHFSAIYKDYMERKDSKEAAQDKAYSTTITTTPIKCEKCKAHLKVISFPKAFGVIGSALALPISENKVSMKDCLSDICKVKSFGDDKYCRFCSTPVVKKEIEKEHEEEYGGKTPF